MASNRTAAPPRRRPPGSLRLVNKTAKGRTYQRWQWRTHRRTDTGWQTVDIEIGSDLAGMRARVLVSLGELSAPLLLERWIRWRFRGWAALPVWTGQPAAASGLQRAAWWVEIPRDRSGAVRIRFRSINGSLDFRRCRPAIRQAEAVASYLWQDLTADPVAELARLQWQEREAQRVADEASQSLITLRRMLRRGELSQRDHAADEVVTYSTLDDFQAVASASAEGYDRLLSDVVAAMPRPGRDRYRSRVLALADRMLSDPKRLQAWKADQWDGGLLMWRT